VAKRRLDSVTFDAGSVLDARWTESTWWSLARLVAAIRVCGRRRTHAPDVVLELPARELARVLGVRHRDAARARLAALAESDALAALGCSIEVLAWPARGEARIRFRNYARFLRIGARTRTPVERLAPKRARKSAKSQEIAGRTSRAAPSLSPRTPLTPRSELLFKNPLLITTTETGARNRSRRVGGKGRPEPELLTARVLAERCESVLLRLSPDERTLRVPGLLRALVRELPWDDVERAVHTARAAYVDRLRGPDPIADPVGYAVRLLQNVRDRRRAAARESA
jgi:hypothetical protein